MNGCRCLTRCSAPGNIWPRWTTPPPTGGGRHPPLLVARLIRGHLDAGAVRLAELGWAREYVSPNREPGQYHLTLTDADDHQVYLDLTATVGPAEDQDRQLAGFVLGTSP